MTNLISITGNLAEPIALKFTGSGKALASARVAYTPRKRDESGQWVDAGETLWLDVTVWGEEAEALCERAGDYKGRVTVTGRLGVRSYEAKDGSTRQAVTVNADAVALHRPSGQAQRSSQQQPATSDPWANQGQQQQGGGWDAEPAPF